MRPYISLIVASVLVAACGKSPDAVPDAKADIIADAVFFNGSVYTVEDDKEWASALAVAGGKLIAVGDKADAMAFAGEGTKTIDLAGRMLMPGIHDTHIHPLDAGIQATLECGFLSNDLQEVLSILKACIADTPKGEWVRGGQWNDLLLVDQGHPKKILDEIAPDHPVFLMDWSVHNAWVNSKALELFGINKDSPNPDGGVIVKDPVTGEPTGLLFDNAAYNRRHEMPAYSAEQSAAAMADSVAKILPYGITTIRDAIVTDTEMEAYQELVKRDALPLRVKTSLTWGSSWAKSRATEMALIERRDQYRSDHLDPDFAKIMLDGIPPTLTAAMLEPYPANDKFPADYKGEMMFSAQELNAAVTSLDAKGLTIKIHATGDGSARAALDAFEAARKANGDSGLIHEVSHAELIDPADMPRFKALNVAAEMCPILWHPIAGLDWRLWTGDRLPIWPVRSLLENDALVTYGSDWPVVPTPNPWPGIEAMVTREDPYDALPGSEYPEEGVDLATTIRVFTRNSAVANKVGNSSGTLRVGKDADFIVLNQNIFEVPIKQVGDTQVLASFIGGELVYGEL